MCAREGTIFRQKVRLLRTHHTIIMIVHMTVDWSIASIYYLNALHPGRIYVATIDLPTILLLGNICIVLLYSKEVYSLLIYMTGGSVVT